MKRLSIDTIKAAYAKSGLRPVRGSYIDGECGCPVGALYVADHPEAMDNNPDVDVMDDYANGLVDDDWWLADNYTTGFMAGWENGRSEGVLLGGNPYDLGIADGIAAAAAILGEAT